MPTEKSLQSRILESFAGEESVSLIKTALIVVLIGCIVGLKLVSH